MPFPESSADFSVEIVSEATLRALELPSLLALLGGLAATDLGQQRALALAPLADRESFERERGRFEEMRRLLPEGAVVDSVEESLLDLLTRLTTGRPPVGGADLVRVAAMLRATHAAAERMTAADAATPRFPLLGAVARRLPSLREIELRIERTLDRRGEVREDASPALIALRRTIRGVRDRLYKQLQSSLSGLRELLSEDTIPLRNNRLVLVLQAGARGQAKGLVHGRSSTGKSYYFEPLDAVEPNNQLQQALEDEESERRRILAELLEAVRERLDDVEAHGEFLGALDLLQAKCRFAEKCAGRLAEVADDGELRLVGARHPLLDPLLAPLRNQTLGQPGHTGSIVPLDVELGGTARMLVVTGPNAGGKTVALKTVGLLALAHQCALALPADAGTRLPFLERIVATVGDEQDLLADRSTFSGRLQRLREAWDAASPRTLVLLDELGSGTDPEEGAALATALLEGLVLSRCLGVITTHLARLAAAALDLDGAACAAMEFAPASGRPTFHLVKGPPGGSEALALARRLGLPSAWLDRAESLLGPEHRDLRRLLAEVERAREEMAAARLNLETEASDLAKIRDRLERERAALEAERRTTGARLKGELERFRGETQQRLRGELERMQAALAEGRKKNLAGEAVARLFADVPRLESDAEPTDGPLVVGQEVRHRTLSWRGVLEKLEGGRAEVQVRGKKLRCDPADLQPTGAPVGAVKKLAKARATSTARDLEDTAAAPVEINLIGARVEAALETLEAYLDSVLLSSLKEVRVIHGHGSGRLREAVRNHLRRHRAVADLRPGAENEGGNGATVVTLRGS